MRLYFSDSAFKENSTYARFAFQRGKGKTYHIQKQLTSFSFNVRRRLSGDGGIAIRFANVCYGAGADEIFNLNDAFIHKEILENSTRQQPEVLCKFQVEKRHG